MDAQLAALCALTFVIHLIGTLAYAVRIAGVRTRRIAVSFALFNVLALVSRTSNSFQGPFLAKRIELALHGGGAAHLLADFRWLLASATAATVVGALAVPTFQRLFSRAVLHFQAHRSIPKLLLHGLGREGRAYARGAVTLPAATHLKDLKRERALSAPVIGLNVGVQALATVAVFASLYAGALEPAYRVTAASLASVISGVATPCCSCSSTRTCR
ncbi:lipid II flippase family protein [Caulobacter sp. KR2-114]|uniref:lipid II flippase family protein n=1 Tax=Caulobacter sp. KR2-114 TaxID=3400912 RepID=UPI003C0FAB92